MNSPSSITPSEAAMERPRNRESDWAGRPLGAPRAALAFALAATLGACGGNRSDEASPREYGEYGEYCRNRSEPRPRESEGAGVVTFHYANKSTDANLRLDLGATDV